MSEWQPIATAPQEGTWFLTWGEKEDYGLCRVLPWMADEPAYDKWGDATHWMPLPAPPSK